MKRTISLLILGCFLFVGCMGQTAHPVQSYQYGDEKKSCPFLRAEVADCEADIDKKYQQSKNKTAANVALGATGLILFWPALFFMDLKGSEKIELEALEKRRKTLIRVAREKECEWCLGKNIKEDYVAELVEKDKEKMKQETGEETQDFSE